MASNLAWGVFSFSLGLNGKLVPRFDYEGFPDTNKTKSVGYSVSSNPNFNYSAVSFILAVTCVYAVTGRFVSNLAYK